jgi:hypothetical protein
MNLPSEIGKTTTFTDKKKAAYKLRGQINNGVQFVST